MRISRSCRTPVLVLASALFLAACGGVATNNGSPQRSGPVDVVKIGAPYPLSGTWAEAGKNSVAGMQAAADVINAKGGISELNGAKIEIVPADTSDDPAQAQNVTKQLIQGQQVTALVGSYLSNLTLTTSTAAESSRVPMLTQSFVDKITERGYKYIFQLPPKSSAFGADSVKYAVQIADANGKPIKRAAVVSSNDAAGAAQAAAVVKAAKAAGIETPDPIVYPPGITDVTPIVGKIQAASPDMVFSYGPVSDTTLIIRNLRERGINAPVTGTGGTGLLDKGIGTSLGKQSEGLMSLSAWNDDMKLPGVPEAVQAYKAKNPGEKFMPQEAGESYVAVMDIYEAIRKSGSADPQAIRDALSTTQFSTGPASGMPPGAIAFDDTGMNKNATPIVIQWQNGQPVTIWPKDVAAAPIMKP